MASTTTEVPAVTQRLNWTLFQPAAFTMSYWNLFFSQASVFSTPRSASRKAARPPLLEP
ncbi:hypothetical protein SAMN05443639_11842 [Stigmatella erecta]|uniref:Uncharacterized protein n=1 Tax=Stigmatella erecta TaxID=83460 RepID=A0A1I0L3I7_9BACT|nr:hypothetical protein SAMN05443639_11842 [Stigmatella erecta]